MKRNPRLVATVLTLSLAPGSAGAKVYTLAVVMQARHANLGSSAATTGASIFDGDRLSTDAKGSLFLRSGGSTIYLSNATQVVLRSGTNGGKGAQAEVGGRHSGLLDATRSTDGDLGGRRNQSPQRPTCPRSAKSPSSIRSPSRYPRAKALSGFCTTTTASSCRKATPIASNSTGSTTVPRPPQIKTARVTPGSANALPYS
jgi:hypothetical protein